MNKDPVLKILAHQKHYIDLLPNLTSRCQVPVYRHIRKLNRKLGEVYRASYLSDNPSDRGVIDPFQYPIEIEHH